jgi:LGFP repeat
LNWELGYLGSPVTDEIDTIDGGGRVSRFEGGELIWREATSTVREVKASDLVVEPFPAGETWQVIQAHGLETNKKDSHFDTFAHCWDSSAPAIRPIRTASPTPQSPTGGSATSTISTDRATTIQAGDPMASLMLIVGPGLNWNADPSHPNS